MKKRKSCRTDLFSGKCQNSMLYFMVNSQLVRSPIWKKFLVNPTYSNRFYQILRNCARNWFRIFTYVFSNTSINFLLKFGQFFLTRFLWFSFTNFTKHCYTLFQKSSLKSTFLPSGGICHIGNYSRCLHTVYS